MTGSKGRASLRARLRGPTATALSRFFRFGTPALVALCAAGVIPWWLALVPVFPVWFSFVASIHAAHVRVRIIREPRRAMGLDEAASERRFLFANAALDTATQERAAALSELAVARSKGDVAVASTTLCQRGRLLVRRVGRWGEPPSPS